MSDTPANGAKQIILPQMTKRSGASSVLFKDEGSYDDQRTPEVIVEEPIDDLETSGMATKFLSSKIDVEDNASN